VFFISVDKKRIDMSFIIFDRRQRQSFIKIDDVARRTLLVNKHRQCSGEHSGIIYRGNATCKLFAPQTVDRGTF